MGWMQEIHNKITLTKQEDINADGQPLYPGYRAADVANRQVDELIGVVKGVMADGMVHQGEVEFLLMWMNNNRGALDKWPAKAIYPRLAAALSDGQMDLREEEEIMDLLLATVGGNTAPFNNIASDSTSLPLCKPAPDLVFNDRVFCFTGKFQSGTRQWCEEQVVKRNGVTANSITKKLHYLVIGDIGSRDWLHSTHGTKIEKAMQYREAGMNLHIVSEEHWFGYLS
ncbi:BRCT domain-containing protein [Oxalicibacterium solurbis]|uniref:NAD-dependent DNA ligase n=1 Tax=Oxalicibacterium solurbis TaxID=69280 RepID=A0A8J3F6I3_9BURK|nr:BRCT domain-containing protein [Oxalicibacterium solurbis]GGI54883.1 hypothetical protein GCM10011430_20570 [Oxalicibacterium solurbis]